MELLTQVVVSGLTLGSLYALVGLGFVVIFRATKVVNFAQGEMMMLGAILALYFYTDLVLPYWLSFTLAVTVCALFGAALCLFLRLMSIYRGWRLPVAGQVSQSSKETDEF